MSGFFSVFLYLPLPSPTLSATSDFSRVRTEAVGSRKDTGAQKVLAGGVGECGQCPGTQVPTLSHIGHFPSASSVSPGGHLCTGPDDMRGSWRTARPPWFCVLVAHSPAPSIWGCLRLCGGPFTVSSGPATFPVGLTPSRKHWPPKALAAPGVGILSLLTLASWAVLTGLLPLFFSR